MIDKDEQQDEVKITEAEGEAKDRKLTRRERRELIRNMDQKFDTENIAKRGMLQAGTGTAVLEVGNKPKIGEPVENGQGNPCVFNIGLEWNLGDEEDRISSPKGHRHIEAIRGGWNPAPVILYESRGAEG